MMSGSPYRLTVRVGMSCCDVLMRSPVALVYSNVLSD